MTENQPIANAALHVVPRALEDGGRMPPFTRIAQPVGRTLGAPQQERIEVHLHAFLANRATLLTVYGREQRNRVAVFTIKTSAYVSMSERTEHSDDQMAAQFERIIRRVKSSMNYRGSYSTRDILGSLVARWVHSGEWDRLKELPAQDRHIGESVRRFILDRLEQVRRRGEREDLSEEMIVLPDEATLMDMIEAAQLRAWIEARIADLEHGVIDPRIRIPLANPAQVGHALRLHIGGHTQRLIATEIGISLGAVNKRILEGTNYLVVLQGIESGVGGSV